MKQTNKIFTTVIFLSLFSTSYLQAKNFSVGPTLGFSTYSLGIGAVGIYDITPTISASGAVEYSPLHQYVSFLDVSANAIYNFQINEKAKAYPLLGLNYFRVGFKGIAGASCDEFCSSFNSVGINIGGGGRYQIQKNIELFSEARVVFASSIAGNLRAKAGALWNF